MKKKLLVVDDSIFIYEEIKFMLKDTDFEIVGYVKNGEQALQVYEELKPHIVILDIIMPGIDGLDTAKIMLSKWPDAKIIIVSSLAYDETIDLAKNIGVCDFMFKPIEGNQLLEVLERIEL